MTFEDYLQDIHAQDYHGMDDDMPDAFDGWLVDLQVDDVIQYAEAYALESREVELKSIINDAQNGTGVRRLVTNRLNKIRALKEASAPETFKEKYERIRMK